MLQTSIKSRVDNYGTPESAAPTQSQGRAHAWKSLLLNTDAVRQHTAPISEHLRSESTQRVLGAQSCGTPFSQRVSSGLQPDGGDNDGHPASSAAARITIVFNEHLRFGEQFANLLDEWAQIHRRPLEHSRHMQASRKRRLVLCEVAGRVQDHGHAG